MYGDRLEVGFSIYKQLHEIPVILASNYQRYRPVLAIVQADQHIC